MNKVVKSLNTQQVSVDSLTKGYLYSTIAQLVERMTVNHDVTGSNPVGGVLPYGRQTSSLVAERLRKVIHRALYESAICLILITTYSMVLMFES